MTRRRLEDLLRRESNRVRRRFRELIKRARNRNTVAKLEQALEEGKASRVVDDFELLMGGLATATEESVAAAAAAVAKDLSATLKVEVYYNTGNARAVAAMQQHRLRLVSELAEEQRRAFVTVLSEATGAGMGPREQARLLRDSLSLTEQQAGWVARYRIRLQTLDRKALGMELRDKRFDGALRKAIESGKPLTSKQVDTMTERYYQRALRYRSEVIARTEALRAVHEASDEVHEQAIQSGHITVDQVIRKWNAARDGRTRDIHASMQGQLKKLGEPFVDGYGNRLRYPGDRNAPASTTAQCRCAVTTRIVPPADSNVGASSPTA